ncbi:concanavalin A-like lectin/glucanase domain-containing protein [Elsinoe ampelina]|uniref:endo-1,3(4)-beta-glucanase n=1 Tax=Elsinoe ampelina TaxID=302913 RepID=A0A6A6GF74_9PEZI|nr:concanavalin A-like lectin/glucanase domain-containing protein [Elsinoe ampelina]
MACIFSRLSLITLFTFLVSSCSAGWVLKDDYNPSNFFSKFSFWTGPDPTHGHVNYVDQGTATANGLIKQRNGGIYMGVDYTNKAPNGRMSVRLTSNAKYNVGSLLILDIKHMPVGCGTWPAYWTVGPNWPNGGEIDIIEGVHNQDHNAMTLHTSEGCTINQNPLMTGSLATSNCYIKAPGQWDNQGCSVAAPSTNTYGKGLNQIQGGVYAVAWQKAQIRVWFFPRGAIPADISAANPKPANWGKPLSIFSGGCNIPQFFKDHQIVFDTTFCGDWAGNVWGQSGCQTSQYPTCQSFVSNNPGAFKNAYWQINSLKVYTQQPNTPTTTARKTTAKAPAAATKKAQRRHLHPHRHP